MNRPHPWGALITFLELTKVIKCCKLNHNLHFSLSCVLSPCKQLFFEQNPRFNFWKLSFTKRDPEIERIFNSVTRLSPSLNSAEEVGVSGVVPDSMP